MRYDLGNGVLPVGEIGKAKSLMRARAWRVVRAAAAFCAGTVLLPAQTAVDPGVRPGPASAGLFVANMTANQVQERAGFRNVFFEVNNLVANPQGIGPGYDSTSCSSCHAQPAMGGSSPASNPLFAVYQVNGAKNSMPSFITANGPVVNARSPFLADGITRDGTVQQLFVITGRTDAPAGCAVQQPNFAAEAAANNLIFRQTTPTFGGGFLEIIQDSDILANMNSNLTQKQSLGIAGRPSIADDGSVSRFGWKAQARSLILFSGEAYNIEEGITNELSPHELIEDPNCATNSLPEDHTLASARFPAHDYDGDPEDLTNFMRFLDQPKRGTATASTKNGETQFNKIGCNLCHTKQFITPVSASSSLSNKSAQPFSDILVHHMGPCLADNVVQGNVQGDEFRTAPLWGVGQRIFFLHDGRTTNIVQAIEAHSCAGNSQYPPSEANAVVSAFNALSATNRQDLVNFLRIL
jgi:CxxC motif-containing protein (DUF1111 family)